jgi:hypothetical protein
LKRIHIPALLCSLLVPTLSGCPKRDRPAGPGAIPAPQEGAFTLPLDVSDLTLGQISTEQVEPLQRYLAASAGWRLTEIEGVRVAIRREPVDESAPDAGKLRMFADGFYFKHQPWRRYRTALRFGSTPLPMEPDWKAVLTTATLGRRDAMLNVKPSNLPDHRSYLSLSGNGPVTLEIMEDSMDTGRDTTRRLLQETTAELKKVTAALPAIRERGFLPATSPKESVRNGPAVLKVESAHQPGAYHLFGYVNPGGPGYTYARALDPSGAALDADTVRMQTLEYVGWSKQPTPQFFFNSPLRLAADVQVARVELWFHPETGAERKLLDAPVR